MSDCITNQCDPCTQYDNCGCVNPTTFGCTSYAGSALPCIGIVNGEDGDSVLAKTELAICSLKENKGKVLIDSADTCPEFLFNKLEEGLNISFNITGEGCDKKIVINAVEGGTAIDIHTKVTSNDTTSGYLDSKIETGTYLTKSIINGSGNEELKIDVVPSTLISTDSGNQITIGTDGALKTGYSAPDGSETKVLQGVGVVVSGTGTIGSPYIISTNPSIQVVRPCFDNIWRNITLVASGNASVVYSSGTPQYRYRYDGTVEFKGQITYNVSFGSYSSGTRKFTVPAGSIPTTCLTVGELVGTSDVKGINYIDNPQASDDQIVQQYGYIIRKSAQNIILEFQSSFTSATAKAIVVNFEGVVIHPII